MHTMTVFFSSLHCWNAN